jgi:hypothetical protein
MRNSTPAIPFYITDDTISCYDSINNNLIINQQPNTTLCQPANIQYQHNQHLNYTEIETLQIISDGTHHDNYITIGGILLINGTKAITCLGKIRKSNNSTNLIIKSYSTYHLMKHLIAITSPENINNNITILLDDRILMTRLHKLNQK